MKKQKGIVLVLSAPSGAGKTTLIKALLRKTKSKLKYSVSATTRPRRKGERNKRDYFFLTEAEFKRGIKAKKFIEWAKVFGNYYGTPKAAIEKQIKKGNHVLLDIDVQGALQLKKKLKDAVFVFILPPSLKELERRLKTRKRDSKKEIAKRFKEAKQEISQLKKYDYFVVNRHVAASVKKIESILEAEQQKTTRI